MNTVNKNIVVYHLLKYPLKILIVCFIFTIVSCSNYEAEHPYFVKITDISVKTNEFYQGAPTYDINEVSVYLDNVYIGTFEKNKLIPIINDDDSKSTLKFYPLVRMNGSKSNVQNYFFLSETEYRPSFEKGQIDTINLQYQYRESVSFAFVEGFENNNIFTEDLDENPNTEIEISTDNPKSGNKCGKIQLDTMNNEIKCTSYLFYDIPTDGKKVILELDYRGNVGFIIGLIGREVTGEEYKKDFIVIKETEDWNKIYLDFTDELKRSKLESYRIYFKARHDEEIESSFIFLDNIKLLFSEK